MKYSTKKRNKFRSKHELSYENVILRIRNFMIEKFERIILSEEYLFV